MRLTVLRLKAHSFATVDAGDSPPNAEVDIVADEADMAVEVEHVHAAGMPSCAVNIPSVGEC